MPQTSSAAGRRRARRRLDERGTSFRGRLDEFEVPHGGWIAAIRQALGMSRKELATRMQVVESTVARLESSERAGTVQLDTLRRAAGALECDLVYVLVPRRPLDDVVMEQARKRAANLIGPVRHTMLLEAQSPPESALQQLIDETALAEVDRPGLWNE